MRQSKRTLIAGLTAIAFLWAAAQIQPVRVSSQVPQIVIPIPLVTPTPVPSPQVTAPPTSPSRGITPYKLARKAVYILATAPDVQTATALTIEVGTRLGPALAEITGQREGLLPKDNLNSQDGDFEFPMLIPEPSWSLDDLAKQCESDPNTKGAILVGPLESDVGTANAFLFANGYQRISSAAFILRCSPVPTPSPEPKPSAQLTASPQPSRTEVRGRTVVIVNVSAEAPTPSPSPTKRALSIVWYSPNFVEGRAHQFGIPLLPLAGLAVVLFGHTTQTVSPYYITTQHAPGTSSTTTNNGGTSSTTSGTTSGTTTGTSTGTTTGTSTTTTTGTTTGTSTTTTTGSTTGNTSGTTSGSTTTTTTGAPITNTSTTVTTGGDQTQQYSAQQTRNDAAISSTLGQLFSVGGAYADKVFPGAVPSTMLKRSAARLANELADRLKEACGNGGGNGRTYILLSGRRACSDVLGVDFVGVK